jgi:hypothetical protein
MLEPFNKVLAEARLKGRYPGKHDFVYHLKKIGFEMYDAYEKGDKFPTRETLHYLIKIGQFPKGIQEVLWETWTLEKAKRVGIEPVFKRTDNPKE